MNPSLEAACAQPLSPLARQGVAEFNRGAYFEAHEAFEAAWQAESAPVREMYQALVQAAAVCLHLKRGNLTGARKVLKRCVGHLETLPPRCQGIEIATLHAALPPLVEAARANAAAGRPLTEGLTFPRLAATPPQSFAGKVALVTGSGRGIGRAIALHFARRGADVVVNFFRNRAPAEETADQIRALGRKALVVKANVGEIADLDTLFEATEKAFGGLDILVHNAASGYNRPAMQQKPRGWDWTMNINARSFLFAAQRAAPLMAARGGGAMVAVSSPGSVRVLPEYVVVGASKAALEAITRYLAVELAPQGIVVNAVSPGVVLTDALKHFATFRGNDIIGEVEAATPAGRLVTPEDVAAVVGFLCTPEAAMIRGQVIWIDGGYSLPMRTAQEAS